MMIAVASDDGTQVAQNPGRCNGFVVFEIGPSTVIRVGYRTACASSDEEALAGSGQDSSTPYAALVMALTDCGALVSREMDDRLVEALKDRVIEGYVCRENSVDKAAQLFARERLRHRNRARRAGARS